MVTLADVARHAKVSQSTVSYVLSGKRSISPATRRRVERSIRTLGYRPHAAARGHAHDVLLLTNDEGPEGLRRVAGSALVDGLVLMDVQLQDERIPVLRELGLPAVLIGIPDDTTDLTCV